MPEPFGPEQRQRLAAAGPRASDPRRRPARRTSCGTGGRRSPTGVLERARAGRADGRAAHRDQPERQQRRQGRRTRRAARRARARRGRRRACASGAGPRPARRQHRERRLGRGQRRGGEALREQVGGGQVAAQVVEDARQPVGAVAAAVAVEIGLAVVRPVVPENDGVGAPARPGSAASCCRRRSCPRSGSARTSRRARSRCPSPPRRCAGRRCGTSPSRKMPRALSAIRLSSASTSSQALNSRPTEAKPRLCRKRLRRKVMRFEYISAVPAAPFSKRLSSKTLSSENM